jgi:hypothetical protein
MMKKSLNGFFVLMKAAVAVVVVACVSSVAASAQGVVREIAPPTGEGSGQSFLSAGQDGRVYLSWIDRLADKRVALRFAVREGAGWSAPRTVAEGENWFVNWADFPSVVGLADGSLAAHWLVRNGPGTYAFDVRLARSFDGGRTWGEAVTPHRDGTQTEHGFVSLFAAAGGRLGAVWLDGREMKPAGSAGGHAHGEMTLRHATLARDGGLADEEVLDARVCECCQTSAALTSEGVVVVYRDRLEGETRDISIVRRARGGGWTKPQTVHADGWKIDACPVNGPSVAASGRRVAVAWYTMAGGKPSVRLAFSGDAGASFGGASEVGDGDPVGRVDLLMLEDGSALVGWVEKTKAGAELRARRVWPSGRRGASVTVAPAGAVRSSSFPQMVRARNKIVFSWTGTSRVLTAEMPADASR